MKKFLKYFIGILTVGLLLLLLLENIYTSVYTYSQPRTKFQYLKSFKNKKTDYIFLGSSRVENGVIPDIIERETGKKVVNFGFQAAKMNDILLLLKLIKDNNIQFDKIFIQIDYIFNINGYSNMLEYEMMPFAQKTAIIKQYVLDNYEEGEIKAYIPFVRYTNYDKKIGFREFLLNVVNKEGKALSQKGYQPLYGSSIQDNYYLPETIVDKNDTFTAIKQFCAVNNMNVVFFCAPFCAKTHNMEYIEKLKIKIPDLMDFSKTVKSKEMFKNCNHLNDEGAKYFTKILIDNCLTK